VQIPAPPPVPCAFPRQPMAWGRPTDSRYRKGDMARGSGSARSAIRLAPPLADRTMITT
jgi:hypothetical protein